MLWFYLLLAVVAGATLPTQAGLNSQLARYAGHPAWASLISFTVGTLALLVYCLTLRISFPNTATLGQAPAWAWLGGLCGALFVATATVVAPRLGPTLMVSMFIAGQMIVSLVLDHFGLIGYAVRPLSMGRIGGALLLVAGVELIRRF